MARLKEEIAALRVCNDDLVVGHEAQYDRCRDNMVPEYRDSVTGLSHYHNIFVIYFNFTMNPRQNAI